MANTANYTVQTQQLADNLSKWKNYIDSNTSVIQSFNDTIDVLQNQIDQLETRVEALEIKMAENTSYLKINISSLSLQPVKSEITDNNVLKTVYMADKTIRSFTNHSNDIYVYANQTVHGMYIDGMPIISANDCTAYSGTKACYKFTGSDKGKTHQILSMASNTATDIKLYFTIQSDFSLVDKTQNTSTSYIMSLDVKPAIAKQTRVTISSDLIPDTTTVSAMTETAVKVKAIKTK